MIILRADQSIGIMIDKVTVIEIIMIINIYSRINKLIFFIIKIFHVIRI